jgi:hypothetical protein
MQVGGPIPPIAEPSGVAMGPADVLILALLVGIVGVVLFILGNLLLKASGRNINEYNRQTRYRKDMGVVDQLTDVYSSPSNSAPMLGAFGLLTLFIAAVLAVLGGIWFVASWLES